MKILQRFALPGIVALFAASSFTAISGCQGDTQTQCADCGTVRDISSREVKGEASAAAAIAGAVIGGVVGNQVGSGSGRDAATAVGAVGGAAAATEVERQRNARTVYEVEIDMANGHSRTITVAALSGLQEGDSVRVIGDEIQPL